MGKIVDLVGKHFNNLEVLSYVNTTKHGKNYLCKCICGNEKIFRGSTLTSLKVIGCGCMIGKGNKNSINTSFAQSKIGEKYNRLEIIDFVKNENSRSYDMVCKCDCGTICNKVYANLVSGKVKSCGCYNKEQSSITGSTVGVLNSKQAYKYDWYIIKNGKKIRMRSGYEVMYAEILNDRGIEWQYEPEIFKLTDSCRYTPDFYLPEYDEWVEVKGWFTDKAKNKCALFKELGYKLGMIFIEDLNSLHSMKYGKFKKSYLEKI